MDPASRPARAAATAQAGGIDRVGTAGAQELRVPRRGRVDRDRRLDRGARGRAPNIYWNPASLAATDQSEGMVSYTSYLGESKVNYGAVSTHLGSQGQIGFSMKILNIGDIIVTTEDAPDGPARCSTRTSASSA